MEDAPPKVFANRLIRQVIDHMGAGLVLTPQDYLALRLSFRHLGGSWEALVAGDPQHLALLKQVATSWAEVPGRRTHEQEFV